MSGILITERKNPLSMIRTIISKIKPMRIGNVLRIDPQFFFDVAIYHFSRIFRGDVDDKLIILGGANGYAFIGNTKYLYKYLKENTDYKLYYMVKSKELQKDLENKGIDTLFAYSLDAIKKLKKARAIFVTHGYFDILPVRLSPRTIAIQTWHGADIKIIGNHPYMTKYIKSKRSILAGVRLREADFFDFILTPSAAEKPRKIIQEVFKFPPERILSIGYPRNDILFPNSPNLTNDLKKKHNIPEGIEKVFLYAPTYREIFTTKEPFNSEDLIKLNKTCKKFNAVLLLKTHINEEVISLKTLERIYVVDKKADIQELLLISDILITDYSSVYCDYLLLKRPILLYVYDYEEYIDQRGIYYDGLDEIAPGPLLYTVDELIEAIENIGEIKKKFAQKARELTDYFNKYKDGNSSERLLRLLKLIH